MPKKKKTGNQYVADPRQFVFLEYYLDPKSETFGNALQSGLKAGYSLEYSESITHKMPDWLAENVGLQHKNKLSKVERNLDEFLDMDYVSQRLVNEEVVEFKDPQLAKIKQNTTHFVAETLGRKYYQKANSGNNVAVQINIGSVLDSIEKENGQKTQKQEVANE